MSVVNKNKSLQIANRFHLHLYHYARGTFPQANGVPAMLLVNRFLISLGSAQDMEGSYIEDNNCHYPLRPGCGYFIPAYHKAGVKLTENTHFISIQFLLDFHNGIDVFSSLNKIMEIEEPTFAQRANEMFDMTSDYLMSPCLHSIVFDFVSRIFREIDMQDLNLDVALSSFQDLNRISETCTAATTVAELADLCGVCRDTFSRTFIRKNGISPKQFLNRCILHRAYTMLSTEDLLVNEVAKKLNFTNEFYFSRFFKKHTGMAPKQFQKKYYA